MAEISRSLEDYDVAEEIYDEAWEIEKSLGQGNHSEVRDRIIKSYEGMLPKGRKRAFQKEVLEFYQRSWDEEKSFEGFQFSQANMKIIDAINERLGEEADVMTRRKYQREAFWFYEGAWNSPDTKKLPYELREHILQTLLRLCKVARNKELFEKYQRDSLLFYEKRWKKNRSQLAQQDRIDLLTTLEDLATLLEDTEKASKYKKLLQKSKGRTFSWRWRSLVPFVESELCPSDDDDGYESSDDDDDDDVTDDFGDNDISDDCDGGEYSGDGWREDENDVKGSAEGDEITRRITEEEDESPPKVHEQEEPVKDLDGPVHGVVCNPYRPVSFLAYFDLDIPSLLHVICCPSRLTEQVKQGLEVKGIMPMEGNSKRDMIPRQDKAFVVVSGGICPFSEEDKENFYLRLSDENLSFKATLRVRLVNAQELAQVEFCRTLELAARDRSMCKLYLEMPTQKINSTKEANGGASRSLPARRPLRVTTVGDEWGSSKGGLSTLNRELAKHLARQPGLEVTILLPNYTESERQDADTFNVRLATPELETKPLSDRIGKLCYPSKDLNIDVVIGHGQKLGAPAQAIAEQRMCKRVHMVHTASEELAMLKKNEKAIPKGEGKHRTEIDLCKEADVVVAIGPKLKESVTANLRWYANGRNEHVINITPGIFSEFAEINQASEEGEKFRILVFGRGDSEDFELKGYDVAAKAVASLNDKNYLLQFVGAPKGNEEEVKNRLLKCGISPTQLTVRGFTESREKLKEFLCEADLAIMPSRTEGFGLTALEALSAGLPILVASNSGFGQAICAVKFGSSCVVCSDDPLKWGEAIKGVRQKKRKLRLEEARSLRKWYDKEYNWETQCEMLVQKMRHILE